MDVLEKSGSNIATQLSVYAMGTMVNKIAGSNIVNQRKAKRKNKGRILWHYQILPSQSITVCFVMP